MTVADPGDDEARVTDLVTVHRARIGAYCARRLPPDEVAEAVARVFEVAWRRRADVPAEPATLPWLYATARHVVSEVLRSGGRRARGEGRALALRVPDADSPEAVAVANDEARAVRAALGELADDDQEILRLAAWEGLRTGEIAGVLGVAPTVAAQRLHRAKERLAQAYLAGRG
jgi:RNA polymerase sigma factor (sigma-70 family)